MNMRKLVKKYLVPHEGNDHKPHLLREEGVRGLAIVIAAVFIFVVAQGYVIRTRTPAAVVNSVIVDLANSDRTARGLKALTLNPTLTAAAQLKANDMAAKSYFAHVSPEGITPWHWFAEANYQFMYAGENLAVNFTESGDVETAWMNSLGHRENILNSKFTEIGVATANGMYNGQPTVFVVQLFGTPMPSNVAKTNNSQQAVQPVSVTPKPVAVQPVKEQPVRVTQVKNMFIAAEDASITPAAAVKPAENIAGTTPVRYSNVFGRLVLSPRHVLAVVYGLLAALIVVAMTMLLTAELKRHHIKMAMYGFVLIVVMGLLAYTYGSFVITQVIVV